MTPYAKRIWNRLVRAYGLRIERDDADVRVLSREAESGRSGGVRNFTVTIHRYEVRFHKKLQYLEFKELDVARRYWGGVFREEQDVYILQHITVNMAGTVRRIYRYDVAGSPMVRSISLSNYFTIKDHQVAQLIMMNRPGMQWIQELPLGFYPISNSQLKDIDSLEDFLAIFTGKDRVIPNRLKQALSATDLLTLIKIVPGEYLNAVAATLKKTPTLKNDEYVLDHLLWAFYQESIKGDGKVRYNAVRSYIASCRGLGKKLNMRIKSVKRLEEEQEKLIAKRQLDRAPKFGTSSKLILRQLDHGEVQIELIKNKKRLGQEAARMNNCVTDYAQEITDGECAIYHVQYRGRPYTMEVMHGPKKTLRLGEVAGLSNRKAPARLKALLVDILSRQQK
jgi:hypothetical protein